MPEPYKDFCELPAMLSANDVVRTLGVSRAFAYNLFQTTEFPVTTIGKRKLVNKESFLVWLKKQERGA